MNQHQSISSFNFGQTQPQLAPFVFGVSNSNISNGFNFNSQAVESNFNFTTPVKISQSGDQSNSPAQFVFGQASNFDASSNTQQILTTPTSRLIKRPTRRLKK